MKRLCAAHLIVSLLLEKHLLDVMQLFLPKFPLTLQLAVERGVAELWFKNALVLESPQTLVIDRELSDHVIQLLTQFRQVFVCTSHTLMVLLHDMRFVVSCLHVSGHDELL